MLDLAFEKPRAEVLEKPVMDVLVILRRIDVQSFEFGVERVEHSKTDVRHLQKIEHLRSLLRPAVITPQDPACVAQLRLGNVQAAIKAQARLLWKNRK